MSMKIGQLRVGTNKRCWVCGPWNKLAFLCASGAAMQWPQYQLTGTEISVIPILSISSTPEYGTNCLVS